MTRPNILWISFEDTSPRFGCYGDPVARTPHVDRLATEGCRFPNTFACAGVCAPSRFAVITGCYPTALGAQHMRTTHRHRAAPGLPTPYDTRVPHRVRCFSEYFRQAGYYCSNNEKTDYQFACPTSAWDECSHTAHWRGRRAGQPFFAVFNPMATHESGMWPERLPDPVTDPASVPVPPWLPDCAATRQAIARQYDHIADNDALVGRLLQELDEDGLADDTIVVVWSDHGEGLPRAKRWLYDSGLRVPMIVRWPGQLSPGSVDQRLVSLLDLAPTMLSCCDLPVPPVMHGRPFFGPLATTVRDYIHAGRDRFDESYDMVRAVRDGRFKYIQNHRPELPRLLWIPYRNRHPIYPEIWRRYRAAELTGPLAWYAQNRRPVEELYDCESDPEELVNLARDPAYADEIVRLRAEHDRWRSVYGDRGDEDEASMVARWYPDGRVPVCEAPVAIALDEGHPGIATHHPVSGTSPSDDVLLLQDPACVQLVCSTQGAAVLWRIAGTSDWDYYAGPIRLATGHQRLECCASRIAHHDSPVVSYEFVVR